MYLSKSQSRFEKDRLKHHKGYTIKEAAKYMMLLLLLPDDTYSFRATMSYIQDREDSLLIPNN